MAFVRADVVSHQLPGDCQAFPRFPVFDKPPGVEEVKGRSLRPFISGGRDSRPGERRPGQGISGLGQRVKSRLPDLGVGALSIGNQRLHRFAAAELPQGVNDGDPGGNGGGREGLEEELGRVGRPKGQDGPGRGIDELVVGQEPGQALGGVLISGELDLRNEERLDLGISGSLEGTEQRPDEYIPLFPGPGPRDIGG